jgi:hypothetical protein
MAVECCHLISGDNALCFAGSVDDDTYLNWRLKMFELGQIVATRGAVEHEDKFPEILARHVTGDWGDCYPEDAEMNNEAVTTGDRIMSVYKFPTVTLWVITEWDRSVTTILLPEEY